MSEVITQEIIHNLLNSSNKKDIVKAERLIKKVKSKGYKYGWELRVLAHHINEKDQSVFGSKVWFCIKYIWHDGCGNIGKNYADAGGHAGSSIEHIRDYL